MMDDLIPITVKSEYDDVTVTRNTSTEAAPAVALPLPKTVVVATIQDADVILGSVHHSAGIHPGNVKYSKLIAFNRDLVISSSLGAAEQLRVAQSIVSTIRAVGGRFLECKKEVRTPLAAVNWFEVSDARAAELTCKELNTVHILAAEEEPVSTDIPAITPTRDRCGVRTETEAAPLTNNDTASPSIATREIDPTMLINLSADQTVNLNYPVGSSVLYNVESTQQCSNAQMGNVSSVSMDLGTRDLLYVIQDSEGNAADTKQYFLEDELAFAPYSPVTIDVKVKAKEETVKYEGEVLSCIVTNGKKLYSVLVKTDRHNVRMFHEVRGDCIRHRRLIKEQAQQSELCNQKEEIQSQGSTDKTSAENVREKSLFNDNLEQAGAESKVAFEVEEVQVPKPQSSDSNSQQKDRLYNISDGSTAQSTKDVPISQKSTSDDDSSSVPSSDSSDAESLFGESTCEKFTAGMIESTIQEDTRSNGMSQRFHYPKSNEGSRKQNKVQHSKDRKKRWGKSGEGNKRSGNNSFHKIKGSKTCRALSKQQKRDRNLPKDAAENDKQGNLHSSSKGNTETGGGQNRRKKESSGKNRERKRWTPSQGSIGNSFGSNHIRFDAPADFAQENKRRRATRE